MARQRQPLSRKTRTREHVLADLAVNHVERQVLLAGFTFDTIIHDYGLDATIFTFNSQGEPEPGSVLVQVKGTEEFETIQDGSTIPFRIERRDLVSWLAEPYPIILAVYEARPHRAYWIYVQRYFENLPSFDLFRVGQTVTIHLPIEQVLTPEAVGQFGEYLRAVQAQIRGRIDHA